VSDSPSNTVGANIRAEMARRKVPQREIADLLDLPQASVSKRLAGEVPWRITELAKIAAFLDVPLAVLLGQEAVA
jgi:predicted transcriptional regulator